MDGTKRPARAVVAAVAVALVAAQVAVVVVVGLPRPPTEPWHPARWDPRVEDLVAFVESERDLDFKHPVPIYFLEDEQYAAATTLDRADVSDEELERANESLDPLVGLGLIEADRDVLDMSNTFMGAGTAALYDAHRGHILVKGGDSGAAVDSTLVHELTHALQDQHFDLSAEHESEDQAEFGGWDAMVEGDATRVENEYLRTLSIAELEEAFAGEGQSSEDAERIDELPVIMPVLFSVPYALGGSLVATLELDGGNDAVDDAFRDPPTTGEHLLSPLAFLAGEEPAEVEAPAPPPGATDVGEETTAGAEDLYLVLATRLDPLTSLDAVSGWSGDNTVPYREGGRQCLAVAVQMDDLGTRDRLRAAFDAWAAAGPPGGATVATVGDRVATLTSCHGEDADAFVPRDPVEALGFLVIRAQMVTEFMHMGGMSLDEAVPTVDCVTHRAGVDTILQVAGADGGGSEARDALRRAADGCIPV